MSRWAILTGPVPVPVPVPGRDQGQGHRLPLSTLLGCLGPWIGCVLFCCGLLGWQVPVAKGRDLYSSEDGEFLLALDSALKASGVVQSTPGSRALFQERHSSASLWRARFGLGASYGAHWDARLTYEQRIRTYSGAGSSAGDQVLAADGKVPFRVAQLRGDLLDGSAFAYTQELDRIYVAAHGLEWELTAGRQAIGLGRARLFGAVDVLSPFPPTAVDQEWRRGVDAVRASYSPLPEFSFEGIAAFDSSLDEGAYLGQARWRLPQVDAAVIAGRRGEDWMFGFSSSAALGDVAAYGDGAVFKTGGGGFERASFGEDWITKLTVGASYVFAVGNGLTLGAEYHYNGFGVTDARHVGLQDRAFNARYARGDFQILGRHAGALTLEHDLLDELAAEVTVLQNPVDGSGVLYPLLRYIHSDSVSIVLAGLVPWGRSPSMEGMRSEYGSYPRVGYVQIRIYD